MTIAFAQEKITIQNLIANAGSWINISFDAWSSDKGLSLLGVVAHFLDREKYHRKTILLGLPQLNSHHGFEQARVLLGVLQNYAIDTGKLEWFVLDNASNNDTALAELSKTISFDPIKRRLRYAGHMINLAAEAFLFGSHPADLNKQLREEGSDIAKLRLWREREPVRKLHHTVIHITRSTRWKKIFNKCQKQNLEFSDNDRIYSLIQDGGVRWNSTYMMIDRAIKLQESLEDYKDKVLRSNDPADDEVKLDQITPDDWEMLTKIKSILKPFYEVTKRLEGIAVQGSYGALWEVVVGLECLIESLEEWKLRLTSDNVSTRQLNICVGLAMDKLMEYVGKTTRLPV